MFWFYYIHFIININIIYFHAHTNYLAQSFIMPKIVPERSRGSREVNVLKETSNNEIFTYADADLFNLLQCYNDSHGKIKETILLFEERHGIRITAEFVNELLSSNIKNDTDHSHRDANGAVSVKEEIEYIHDELDISHAINILKQENCNLLPYTYVYTTRLDEMNIFNIDFSNLSVKTIEKRIILESKPDKSKIHLNSYRSKNNKKCNRLIEKIEILNAMIRKQAKAYANSLKVTNYFAPTDTRVCRESLELYKLCKPLTVPLKDCLKYPLEISKSNNKLSSDSLLKKVVLYGDSNTSQTSVSYRGIAPKVEHNEPVNLYPPKQLDRIAYSDIINQDVFIVMKNIFSSTTEICHVPCASRSPASYYDIDHVIEDDNELFKYVDKTIVELVNCCWFNRRQNIEKLFMSRLLKKPHLCHPPELCTCCCSQIQKDDPLIIPTRKTYWPIQNDNTFMYVSELNRNISNVQTVINKALVYSKKHTKVNIHEPAPPYRINKTFNFALKTKMDTEYYMSGYNYFNDMNTLKNEKNLLACCWYKRRSTASVLDYPESTLIFEPHGCPALLCYCCCRPSDVNKKQNLPIILPTDSLQNYRSKFIRGGNLQIIQSIDENTDIKGYIESSISSTSTASILNSCLTKSTSIENRIKPVLCNQANIQPLVNQEPNITILHNKSFQDPALKDPVVYSLFASILDKYKNIRLTVGNEGLVSVNLDTPIKEMSTDDLKMLTDLVKHVQKQVDSIKQLIDPPANNLYQATNPPPSQSSRVEPALVTATAVPIVVDPPVFMTLPNSAPQNNKSKQVNFDINALDGNKLPQAYKYLTQIKTEQYRLSCKSYSRRTSRLKHQVVSRVSEPVTPLSQPIIQNVFSLKGLDGPSTSGIKRKAKKGKAPTKRLRVKTPAELATTAAATPQNVNEPIKAAPSTFNEEFCNIQPSVVSQVIQPLIPIIGMNDLPILEADPNLIQFPTVTPPPLVTIPGLIKNLSGCNPANTAMTMPCLISNSALSNPVISSAVPMQNKSNESGSTNIPEEESILGY